MYGKADLSVQVKLCRMCPRLDPKGFGGERGIRTHGTVSGTLAFEASAFRVFPRDVLLLRCRVYRNHVHRSLESAGSC